MTSEHFPRRPMHLEPTSDQTPGAIGNLELLNQTQHGTTSEMPKSESGVVASGSIAPTMTGPSLVANFLSGQLVINWSYFAKIFQVGLIIAAVLFTSFIFYRDNELGRLQDQVGLQQFGMKAVSIISYAVAMVLITAIILWISKKRKKTS